MLYKEMVRDKRLARGAGGRDLPDGRYPNLFVFFPAPSLAIRRKKIRRRWRCVARLKTQKVDAETLARVKTQAQKSGDQAAGQQQRLAGLLVTWVTPLRRLAKDLFWALDELNKVTADDVQRVAQKTFVATNRTVAYTRPGGQL